MKYGLSSDFYVRRDCLEGLRLRLVLQIGSKKGGLLLDEKLGLDDRRIQSSVRGEGKSVLIGTGNNGERE